MSSTATQEAQAPPSEAPPAKEAWQVRHTHRNVDSWRGKWLKVGLACSWRPCGSGSTGRSAAQSSDRLSYPRLCLLSFLFAG